MLSNMVLVLIVFVVIKIFLFAFRVAWESLSFILKNCYTENYSESCQFCKMVRFTKIVYDFEVTLMQI